MTGKAVKRRLAVLLCLAVAACTSLSDRQALAPRLTHEAGWSFETLTGGPFAMAAAIAPLKASPTLVVYLEGDGLAYVDPSRPAHDPTPRDPIALRLALAHPDRSVNVAWLGRPCQYGTSPRCQAAYWTDRRYAPEIVDSVSAAIDQLKARSHAANLTLVGYSGGGAIAALLAARRGDVARLVTVVADLDLAYWTARQKLTPLAGSLDPADFAPALAAVPQVHFTGGKDQVVGTEVARAYLAQLPASAPARLIEVPGFTHACCWVRDWPRLFR
jgi:pimeloyl-ACP methyl ester carboxylesterase